MFCLYCRLSGCVWSVWVDGVEAGGGDGDWDGEQTKRKKT